MLCLYSAERRTGFLFCLMSGLKIMVRFAAGVNMHHAVLNFRKLFFYLFVNVFGNGVCFYKR